MTRKLLIGLVFLSLLGGIGLTLPPPLQATVNEDSSANRYTANGSGTAYTYTFKILSKRDIDVLVDTAVKTLDVDYTVSGVGSATGGTITFLAAPANLTTVTLLRKQPASQLSTYFPNEPFPSTRVERDYDRLVMSVQQLKEQMGRALLFPKQSALTGQFVDAPTVGLFARAKVGGGVDWAAVASGSGVTLPVSVADGGTGATTAAAALTNLGAMAATPAASLVEPLDSVFRIQGSGDPTKKLAFEVDGIAAGTTRTLTPPNADLTLPAVTAAGDLPIASASGVLSKIAVGAAGTIPMSRAAAPLKLAYVAALNWAQYGNTYGPGDGAGGGDLVNDVTLTAGGSMDGTFAYWMQGAAITKQLDAVWAVGTNAGCMDVAFPASTVTITIASPAVVSWTTHGLAVDETVIFSTTGALPTGLTAGTKYWIISAGFGANSFQVSTSAGGAAVNTSGSESGVHTATGFYNRGYYLWRAVRSDTGVVDVLCSQSATAPTMPANYDFKRLRGWVTRVAGTIVAFKTYEKSGGGIDLAWDAPTLDVTTAGLTTSRRTDAVKVPLNFSVTAHLNVVMDDGALFFARICDPNETDAAPSTTVAPLFNFRVYVATQPNGGQYDIRTNASGQIAARASAAVSNYKVSTLGFTWDRRE